MGYLAFRKPQSQVTEGDKQRALESGLKISVLVPTRNRPHNVDRMLQSIWATSHQLPEVIFYKDDDDDSRFMMPGEGWQPADIKVITGPRVTLSSCWNKCYEKSTGDIVMFCGDDVVFKTPGWDTMVINAFADHHDKIIFVHGDDGAWGKDFGTHGFMHRKWIDAVGYVLPPYFSSDFGDKWINEVANLLHRRVFLPFVTEHLHPLWGKGEWDQTHRERLERHKNDDVDKIYAESLGKRLEDVAKLRRAIGGPTVTVMIPSRGRPEGLNRSIESLLKTAKGNVEVLVRIDSDDQIPKVPDGVKIFIGQRHGYKKLHCYYNEMAQQATGDWLMVWNDDAVMTEQGWDLKIGEQKREPAVLNLSGRFNIFPVVSRELYKILGHISLQAHSDTWLQVIARMNGIEKYVPLTFLHEGAENPERYAETRPEFYSDPVQKVLLEDVDKVKAALSEAVSA